MVGRAGAVYGPIPSKFGNTLGGVRKKFLNQLRGMFAQVESRANRTARCRSMSRSYSRGSLYLMAPTVILLCMNRGARLALSAVIQAKIHAICFLTLRIF